MKIIALAFLQIFVVQSAWSTCAGYFPSRVSKSRPKNFEAWRNFGNFRADQNPRKTNAFETYEPALDLPFLVVGGGPAGMAAGAALRAKGLPVTIFESFSDFGGVWNIQNPHSPVYEGVRTNSSKGTTYLDKKPGKEVPTYMGHQDAMWVLREFAERHGLRSITQFRRRVTSVKTFIRHDGALVFRVRYEQTNAFGEVRNGKASFRAIVPATGVNTKENASLPEKLREQARINGVNSIHSSDYGNPFPYTGKRVLVVGAGNSATEIATEISQHAKRTVLAVRSAPWIVPTKILGIPADVIASGPSPVPHSVEMFFFHLLQRAYVGHPKSLKMQGPNHDLLEKLPVSDRGIVQAIKEGRVEIRENVDRFADGLTYFANSANGESFDTVIFATGYRRRIPFLPESMVNYSDPNFEMSFHLFHPTQPGIAVMNEVVVPQGTWPMQWAQAKALAAYFAAETAGSRRAQEFNRIRQTPNPDFKGDLFKQADDYHVDPHLYEKALQDFIDWMDGATSR